MPNPKTPGAISGRRRTPNIELRAPNPSSERAFLLRHVVALGRLPSSQKHSPLHLYQSVQSAARFRSQIGTDGKGLNAERSGTRGSENEPPMLQTIAPEIEE